MNTTIEILTAAVSHHTDETIWEMIAELDARIRTTEETLVMVSLYEVIESRYDVADAMEAWVMSDSTLTYAQALHAAVEAL